MIRGVVFCFNHFAKNNQSVRYIRHKPWHPKFRLIRRMQPWPGPVDFQAETAGSNESPAELRAHLKRNGMLPSLIFFDRPINIGHTGQVTDAYRPPDGDGRSSLLSVKRATQEADGLLQKGKNFREVMKIRKHDYNFNTNTFPHQAEFIYKEAHQLLQNAFENQSKLFELVTEKAFAEMVNGLRFKTLLWNFIGNIEAPRIVQVRTSNVMSKDNMYGQVTVRFHTQQTFAVFDRFGRLQYGNPSAAVDVLEYVVFEKHISDEYGLWRLHAKIIPDWAPPVSVYLPSELLAPEKTEPCPPVTTEQSSSTST